MDSTKITVSARINSDTKKVWDYYTQPIHITKWNFADPSWHCPSATNELKVGGQYNARMEAKDGSFGFDFIATYSDLKLGEEFTFLFGDRTAHVSIIQFDKESEITITFDPENENSIELQKNGWQAILNNFKSYVEAN